MKCLFSLPFLLLGLEHANGHGFLETPRSRNYVANIEGGWSGSSSNVPMKETCHHCLNIPSVCGTTGSNNYDTPKSVTGGTLDQPRIQATYQEGQTIDIEVMLTAHHKGHFTFKVCPVQPYEVPTQQCFDAHPLEFVSDNMYGGTKDPNYPDRAYIANPDHPSYTGAFNYTFKLPTGVTGNMVLLQWHWISANSCLPPGYDQYTFPPYFNPGSPGMCTGGNLGEQFWNCAEITITPSSPSSPVTPPVAAPVAAPVAVPVAVPVPAPVATPVAAPVAAPVESPMASPVTSPVASPVTSPVSSPGSCAPTYKTGYSYAALDKVSYQNNNYECKPHPYTAWCSGAAWAYEPGVGLYWDQAWNKLGSCGGSTPIAPPVSPPVTAPVAAPVTAPVTAPVAAPVTAPVAAPVTAPVAAPVTAPVTAPVASPTSKTNCAPAYVEGTKYVEGQKATGSDKKEYECKPYPYTGWCSGAAWAYAPGTGTAWTDCWILLGTCNGEAPVSTPVSQPVAQPVSQPVAQPVAQPLAQPVSQPVAQPISQPVAQPVSQPVSQPVANPTSPTAPTSSPTAIQGVESVLDQSKTQVDTSLFLYETPQSQWVESTVYRYNGFVAGLRVMYQDGVAGKYFYMGEDGVANGHLYGLVNIAAFLAQSMKETIKYDACDENSWDLVNGQYPLSNACGQLGQSYEDYHCSAAEKHMECPVDPDMEIRATTNAKWWGAPQPLYCGPRSKYPQTGYWDYSASCTNGVCDDYPGQKGGAENNSVPWANSNGRTDVEGCCWWGRGVIQTTGICNFGKLNYFLGKRAHDEGRSSRYPTIDFCKDPGAICSSTEFQELKWIAGMFYWVESLQTYNSGGWNYMSKLKAFVDGGMTDMSFIDAVSGIVNRGCHNPPCGTGPLDGGAERKKHFQQALSVFNLTATTTARKLRGNTNESEDK